ncbi:MAG: methyl-accepting chemotaxis protein [Planctomycetota bacterium]
MRLPTKILALATASAVLPIVAVLAVTGWQRHATSSEFEQVVATAAERELHQAVKGALTTLRTQDEVLREKVSSDLRVAEEVVATRFGGAIRNDPEQTVTWNAVNQFTKSSDEIELPRFVAGETWLGQVASAKTPAPVVDDIQNLVGGTCTIFQRMNAEGDMLRVATNVEKLDGSRAIGTYIPAKNPDGSPNGVVSTVMRGETFRGRAFVVNAWYLTAYKPILDDSGEVSGILYVGIKQENVPSLRAAIRDAVPGETGQLLAVAGSGDRQGDFYIGATAAEDGTNISTRKNAEGEAFMPAFLEETRSASGEAHATAYTDETTGEQRFVVGAYFEPWDWTVLADAPAADFDDMSTSVQSAFSTMTTAIVITAVLLTGVAALMAWTIGRRIAAPIRDFADSMIQIADGDGDLTRRLDDGRSDELGSLASAFNRFVQRIESLIREVMSQADAVRQSAEQIASSSNDVSDMMSEQRTKAGELSNGFSELNSAINSVAENCTEAARDSQTAGEDAKQGQQSVQETIDGVSGVSESVQKAAEVVEQLGEKSHEIGSIIETINEIAEQTNLLALNAAIEAARAGEHGRGFAVVADEVRKLAERTTGATEEITVSIGSIVTDTERAVADMQTGVERVEQGKQIAGSAGERLSAIVEGSLGLSSKIEQIAAAAEEQASTTERVAETVNGMSSEIGRASEVIAGATAGASDLSRHANELAESVSRFKITQE